jgi:hypothetical protein
MSKKFQICLLLAEQQPNYTNTEKKVEIADAIFTARIIVTGFKLFQLCSR